MIVRVFLVAACLLVATFSARAEERIELFDVGVVVEKDGDILVTEAITVRAEGNQIRRGIFRDLPRTYVKGRQRLPYKYNVQRVTRDGAREPYKIEKDGNAYRIRIGDADVLLQSGAYTYEIVYEVKNQVRYFDGYDEIYWNATGTYWAFPIEKARVRVSLPDATGAVQQAAYTGRQGSSAREYVYQFAGGVHAFETTKPLQPREGLTIAVGFEKGVVDPPSAADARADWLAVNATYVALFLTFLGVGSFYVSTWRRVGRDPVKGPVFPHYEPPDGFTPAAVHHVYHRGFSGHNAFIATLTYLGVRGLARIDVESSKETRVTHLAGPAALTDGAPERDMLESLASPGESFTFGGDYNSTLTHVYGRFKESIGKQYGKPYFHWNRGFLIVAIVVSALGWMLANSLAIELTNIHTIAAFALGAMALAGAYFLPAPTEKGQKIRTEIEGFRLYLKTAEQLQLNAVEVGSDAPPPLSVERYERFLPYAIALGVEKPWTEHFEKLMPREAADYRPSWANAYGSHGRSLHGLSSALVSGIASGVASSLPQSSSSSGSGGGGSSGGGGGGGGGGGW